MLDRVSSTELSEWAVHEQEYGPLGPRRDDILAALVASTVANTASKTKVKPADFVPKWGGRRRQSGEEQSSILRNFFRLPRGGDQ